MKLANIIYAILLISIIILCLYLYYKKVEPFLHSRKCYVLTCNESSERSQFSKNLLEKIGFEVHFFQCIKNENKVLSNKISMQKIYEIIANGQDEWVYVFEDDINILADIDINEIVQYEKISNKLFYLGLCGYENPHELYNKELINGHKVAMVKDSTARGLHAISLSKEGAKELLEFSQNAQNAPEEYMDVILEAFVQIYNPNIVRYDLESYIPGHRGIFFQDRNAFPTTI
jgi:hypothetical protein